MIKHAPYIIPLRIIFYNYNAISVILQVFNRFRPFVNYSLGYT